MKSSREAGQENRLHHTFACSINRVRCRDYLSRLLSENCLFGIEMPQYWPQGGAVETTAPHLLGLAASISRRATSTY